MNPSCFLDTGRGVYEVEEEMLKLSEQGKWLRLKWMEYRFGMSVENVLRNRLRYYMQFAPEKKCPTCGNSNA